MNKEENKEKTYYEEKRDELIEKLKKAVDQCFKVIEDPIDDKISDDKLHNVLKGKRMASEDSEHYLGQIKKYENEKNGVVEQEKPDPNKPKNWSKEFARKPA